ncbi:MAG: hypothetical protein V1875_08180 [Candidatus Altiarchaeota archaeon]
MEVSHWVFAKAFVVTVLVLVIIYSLNVFLNSKREISITDDMDASLETMEEMQALTYLAPLFHDNETCVTLKSQLKLLDTQTWKLGNKIEDYHKLTQEYMSNPEYYKQKRKFNRQEVMYLSLLRQIRDKCSLNQSIILYFYSNPKKCQQCDQQAFVLTHLHQKMDQEISIFSFDYDLDLPSVSVLKDVYNVGELPCIVIEDGTYCGLQDKETIERVLCEKTPYLSICAQAGT